MTIIEINQEDQWNDFLIDLQPNTFLQSWEWGQAQQRLGDPVRYLALLANNRQIGACLVITVNARRGRHYLIPHGPLFLKSLPLKHLLRELITYLCGQASRDRVAALRVAPLLENTPDNRHAFRTLGFRPSPLHVHAELTWIRDITPPEEQILADMRKTTRHAIRRAEAAGVTAEITKPASPASPSRVNALDRFYHLYEQTQTRHHFIPYSRETLTAQLEEFGRHDRVYAVFARHENHDVAAAICFHFGRTVFYYHGASIKLPASIPAAQLVQWAAIKEAKRRGAARYNFWGIAPPAGKAPHPFAGLTIFKTGFGGYSIDYLHAQDLPLSPWYWKLWLIETLRKKKRGF